MQSQMVPINLCQSTHLWHVPDGTILCHLAIHHCTKHSLRLCCISVVQCWQEDSRLLHGGHGHMSSQGLRAHTAISILSARLM